MIEMTNDHGGKVHKTRIEMTFFLLQLTITTNTILLNIENKLKFNNSMHAWIFVYAMYDTTTLLFKKLKLIKYNNLSL